jgi:hypothetical protein
MFGAPNQETIQDPNEQEMVEDKGALIHEDVYNKEEEENHDINDNEPLLPPPEVHTEDNDKDIEIKNEAVTDGLCRSTRN